MKKNLSALLSLILVACGPLPEEMAQENLTGQGVESARVDVLATKEKITEEFKIGPVEVGDTVELALRGKSFKDEFSDVYARTVSTQWSVEDCYNDRPERPDRPGRNKVRECYTTYKEGSCQANFRDYLGEKESPLAFPQDIAQVRLKYRVDGKLYDLGKLASYTERQIVVQLPITEELVQYSNNLDLVVLSAVEEGSVAFGHVGPGNCNGSGKDDFKLNLPVAAQTRQKLTRFEFFADIRVIHAK